MNKQIETFVLSALLVTISVSLSASHPLYGNKIVPSPCGHVNTLKDSYIISQYLEKNSEPGSEESEKEKNYQNQLLILYMALVEHNSPFEAPAANALSKANELCSHSQCFIEPHAIKHTPWKQCGGYEDYLTELTKEQEAEL